MREPTAAPDLVPRHILQQTAPEPRGVRIRRRVRNTLSAVALHAGFAAAFLALLTWRPAPPTREIETPVDVVMVEPPAPPRAEPKPEPPKPEAPKPEAPKAEAQAIPQPPALAPAPDPHPPAPPAVQPPPSGQPLPSPLLAPPPEPTRARTQTERTATPNLEPDPADKTTATHEAKPAEAPKVLSTTDTKAAFAVPKPDVPKPQQPEPGPEAKTPSETEKLAAALPADTSALPDAFRAVLSGNGAAVDAAYKGLVYGRFSRSAEIGERARRQHLKGQVIVAFTIDDDGRITSLAVLQSSGNPTVDALGMELIRSAAPFPPPPPGAQRSFTPALAFGE